jgi:hypothetical protein
VETATENPSDAVSGRKHAFAVGIEADHVQLIQSNQMKRRYKSVPLWS